MIKSIALEDYEKKNTKKQDLLSVFLFSAMCAVTFWGYLWAFELRDSQRTIYFFIRTINKRKYNLKYDFSEKKLFLLEKKGK